MIWRWPLEAEGRTLTADPQRSPVAAPAPLRGPHVAAGAESVRPRSPLRDARHTMCAPRQLTHTEDSMTDRDDRRDEDVISRSEDEEVRRGARERRELGETIGRGMTSPDSTEIPLSAETGEPDERARGDRDVDSDTRR
jgi:hypothetical protein